MEDDGNNAVLDRAERPNGHTVTRHVMAYRIGKTLM